MLAPPRPGLSARRQDPADRRSSRIAPTAAALPGASGVLLAGNREAMAGFTPEEAASFLGRWGRVQASLDALSDVGATPAAERA